MPYCDSKYYGKQTNKLMGQFAMTSAQTTGIEIARSTVMGAAVTVQDFNVQIGGSAGDTGTSGSYQVVIAKSAAGTGALSAIGTASWTATGAIIHQTNKDASVTATNFAVGDDIVLRIGPGTVLPAGSVTVNAVDISLVEYFNAG